MQTPSFSFQQYLDEATLNSAMSEIASGIGDFTGKKFSNGLVRPDVISVIVSGQTLNSTLPSPFGVLFNSGLFSTAHGNINGVDTQSYVTPFTSLFPASGSVTAYLLAAYSQVYQSPIIISGPPVGHQAYDPAFIPYTAYTVARDTLALTASTGIADNQTTFELARCTLNAGSGAIAGLTFSYRQIASPAETMSPLFVTGNLNLSYPIANTSLIVLTTSGLTISLPLAVSTPGAVIPFLGSYTSGFSSFAASGTDKIYGFQQTSLTTISIPPRGFVTVASDGTNWNAVSINPNDIPLVWTSSAGLPNPISISSSGGVSLPYSTTVSGNLAVTGNTGIGGNLAVTGTVTSYGPLLPNGFGNMQVFTTTPNIFTVPAGVTKVAMRVIGGGGGGGGATASLNGFSSSAGAAGGTAEGIYSVTPGSNITVIVGPGGSGGDAEGNGNPGATSSFVGFCSGTGGGGGIWSVSEQGISFGGIGVGGTINYIGEAGAVAIIVSDTDIWGGDGGSAALGGAGGRGALGESQPGQFPGGGGASGGGDSGAVGAAGAGGVAIIWW